MSRKKGVFRSVVHFDVTAARQAIRQSNQALSKAFAEGDASAVAALYTEDATLLAPDADMVNGREAIQAFWAGAMAQGIASVELTSTKVEGAGSLAYEVGRYAVTAATADGAQQTSGGKYVVVWKQQEDGGWKLHVDIWNANAPAGE